MARNPLAFRPFRDGWHAVVLMTETLADVLAARFARAGARGFLHARELASGAEVGLHADAPVAVASVIKVAFAIAFAREVAAGRLDARERVEVPDSLRLGGSGTTGFLDPPLISLRDLARLMLTVSDNAATDVVLAATGRAAVTRVLDGLDLRHTHARHDMAGAHRAVVAELGLDAERDLDAQLAQSDPDAVRALDWLDPAHANASTPREVTALLAAIWTDRAGPAEACAFVREAMGEQVTTQRLASGFGPEVAVAGKTGTLPGVRNEAGVVTLPDGRRVAIAVFTRCESLADRNPAVDAAIGDTARMAVKALLGKGSVP
jgi:beta-lactamase class A